MKFIGFIIGVMLTVIGFWLGGYNFNERGDVAVHIYLTCILSGIIMAVGFAIFED